MTCPPCLLLFQTNLRRCWLSQLSLLKIISLKTKIWIEMIMTTIHWRKNVFTSLVDTTLPLNIGLPAKLFCSFMLARKPASLHHLWTKQQKRWLVYWHISRRLQHETLCIFRLNPGNILLAPPRKRMNQLPLKLFADNIWIQGACVLLSFWC